MARPLPPRRTAATIMPMRVSGSTCTAPMKISDWVTVGNTHWPLRVPGSSRSSISELLVAGGLHREAADPRVSRKLATKPMAATGQKGSTPAPLLPFVPPGPYQHEDEHQGADDEYQAQRLINIQSSPATGGDSKAAKIKILVRIKHSAHANDYLEKLMTSTPERIC